MRAKNIEELKKYFMKIGYISPYETSAFIDLIFALVTHYTVKARTVVELRLGKFLKKQYSSLFKAIEGYFISRKNKEGRTVPSS